MPSLYDQRGTRSWFSRLARLWSGTRAARAAGRSGATLDQRLIFSLSRHRPKLPSWRQIRHLPEVLSRNDSLRLQLGVLLLAAGLAVLGARLYFAHTQIVPAVGGTLTEAVVGTPRSLNPIYALTNDVDADLTRLLFSRLYAVDGDGKVTPDVILGQEISEDQKTYILTLRDDVRWHDGEPMTAEDVAFTLALIQDPAWKSPYAPAFKDVTVETPDARTIRLTLKEPFAPFLSRLSFGILPKHVWKDATPQNASMLEANLKPIGSGPFKFDVLTRDRRGFVLTYGMKRNADYYLAPAYLEEIVFKFYPDYDEAIAALRRREVSSLSFVPRNLRHDVKDAAQALTVSLELPQYTAVFFNQRNNATLQDADVRKALTMAIDKRRILFDVLGGDGHPIEGPPLPGFEAPEVPSMPFKLEDAAALLDGKGWKLDAADGIRKKTPEGRGAEPVPLRVTLTAVDQPETLAVAQIVKDGWNAIGVDVALSAVPASDIHRTVIRPREYQALLYGQLLGADPDPYPFWHSSQVQDPGLNLALFSNKDADAAIETAEHTADDNVRQEQYRAFLEILAREMPAIFLYSPSYTYAIPNGLLGFTGSHVTIPSDRFATVTSWYLETERAWN